MNKLKTIIKRAVGLIAKDLWEMKWFILIMAIYMGTVWMGLHKFCPLFQVIGFPCPGCGVSRGTVSVFLLRYKDAYDFNPTSFIWAAFFIYCFVFRYFIGKKPWKVKELFILFTIIMTGVHIYRMIYIFPTSSPLQFYEKNTLGHILPGYNDYVQNIFYKFQAAVRQRF